MTSIIDTIKYALNDHVGDIVISFLSHPIADLMKAYFEYTELCSFDRRTDWTKYNGLYGWTMIGPNGKVKHYITYGGGPEGGLVRCKNRGWYVWHRDWGVAVTYLKVPDGLDPVYYDNDGAENVKLATNDYYWGDHDYLWDDILEMQEENESEEEEEEEIESEEETEEEETEEEETEMT